MRVTRVSVGIGRWLGAGSLLIVSAARAPVAAAQPKPAAAAQPKPAAAQPKPDAAAMAEAKRSFETGLRLYKEGSFREALAAFLLAKKAMPRESIQRNIAQCYRELKEFGEAFTAYTELLDVYGAKMRPDDVAAVRRALEELRLLSGAIRVTVAEPDASVRLGDRDLGTTPLPTEVRVNIGSHKVTVSKAGFDPLVKTVEVKGNDLVVVDGVMSREVLAGRVVVTVDGPPGATLFLDGKEVSTTFPWEGDVPVGPHELEARGPNLASSPKKLEVTRGARIEVSLRVESQAASVIVEAGRPEATISVDGAVVGTGVWQGPLAPGKHDITVEAQGFEPIRRVILPRAGEALTLRDFSWVRVGPAPAPPPPPHDYTGVYSHLSTIAVSTKPSHQFATACPTQGLDVTCKADPGLGPGVGLRVGYSYGTLGLEGFAIGLYDRASATVHYPSDVPRTVSADVQGVARKEEYVFHRYGGSVGMALRATSRHESIRFTAGMGGGLAYRLMVWKRQAEAISPSDVANSSDEYTSNNAAALVPSAVFDAGMLVGSSPGTKFHLGAMLMLDFLPNAVATDAVADRTLGSTTAGHKGPIDSPPTKPNVHVLGTPRTQTASGTPMFLGLTLGMRFGE